MNDFTNIAARPDERLFYKTDDAHDLRLGSIVSTNEKDYGSSEVIIAGLKNENNNSDAIRGEFYKLTNFGINRKIFDLGDLDSTDNFSSLTEKILEDGKRLIVIGGENISYYSGAAMTKVFGGDRWLGININSYLDTLPGNSSENKPAFRRLIEEKLIVPHYFYEIGFQPYFCTPAFYRFLQNQGVKMVSLEQLRSRETPDLELRELIRQEFISHSRSMSIFFNFSLNAVRASDAPGVSASSPFGLRAGEFLTLVQFAAKLVNTKFVQFTDFRSDLDHENRTAKLIAIGMHRYCSSLPKIG